MVPRPLVVRHATKWSAVSEFRSHKRLNHRPPRPAAWLPRNTFVSTCFADVCKICEPATTAACPRGALTERYKGEKIIVGGLRQPLLPLAAPAHRAGAARGRRGWRKPLFSHISSSSCQSVPHGDRPPWWQESIFLVVFLSVITQPRQGPGCWGSLQTQP